MYAPAIIAPRPRISASQPDGENFLSCSSNAAAAISTAPIRIKSSQSRCGPITSARIMSASGVSNAIKSTGKWSELLFGSATGFFNENKISDGYWERAPIEVEVL